MGHKRLLETNADIILQQKINLRAPYVTPLNVLQVRRRLCGARLRHVWIHCRVEFHHSDRVWRLLRLVCVVLTCVDARSG